MSEDDEPITVEWWMEFVTKSNLLLIELSDQFSLYCNYGKIFIVASDGSKYRFDIPHRLDLPHIKTRGDVRKLLLSLVPEFALENSSNG